MAAPPYYMPALPAQRARRVFASADRYNAQMRENVAVRGDHVRITVSSDDWWYPLAAHYTHVWFPRNVWRILKPARGGGDDDETDRVFHYARIVGVTLLQEALPAPPDAVDGPTELTDGQLLRRRRAYGALLTRTLRWLRRQFRTLRTELGLEIVPDLAHTPTPRFVWVDTA